MGQRARTARGFGRLHVLTDPDGPHPVLDVVDAALAAGVPTIQVRSKQGSDRCRLAEVVAVTERCHAAGATCIVNDRVDLALAATADGVHLGDDDLTVAIARRLLGPDAIVGATVRDVAGAAAAEADGASYLGIGPTFATATKTVDVDPLGPSTVATIARSVAIPAVAIAGITVDAVPALLADGVAGVAVIGAVSRAGDPGAACTAFLDAIEQAA